MNALTTAIKEALSSPEDSKKANKAYLEFIKANLIVPVELEHTAEEPKVLFLQDEFGTYLPVFTELTYLDEWATDIADKIQLLRLSGVDLLKGLGEETTVCLDLGTDHYKAFHPSEMKRLQSMVLKLFKTP